MTLTEMLQADALQAYSAAEGLIKLVDEDKLSWKPATGKNWMTTGQVLKHCTEACGTGIKGFVTGDWNFHPDTSTSDTKTEEMLPPAEKLPTVSSVREALELIEKDKQTALKYLTEAGEANLLTKKMTAPWGGPEATLFQHLNTMIGHLSQHKTQLFYYLKLQAKDVNTSHLWGM
jgi:hypothetical protein